METGKVVDPTGLIRGNNENLWQMLFEKLRLKGRDRPVLQIFG